MARVITIVANATKAKLLGADEQAKLLINEKLSYSVEGREYMERYQSGDWDGRQSMFAYGYATFPAGFVGVVSSTLRAAGYRVLIKKKRLPPPKGPSIEKAYEEVNPFEIDPKYSYQPETVRRLEKYGQMIAQIATGGGKSMIARTAVRRLMRPTIFLTTRQVLMYQMKGGFEEAGFNVGVMGDGEWSPRKGVNVAMIQSIHARLTDPSRREATLRLLSYFEFAILEEAHEASSESFTEVMNSLPNALYRLSLTATPFMRSDSEANMRLMAVSGQVGVKVSEKMLIDREILARPIFRYVKPRMPQRVTRGSAWARAYDLGVVNNADRNLTIVNEVEKAISFGLSVMVLVQRKAHGKLLCEGVKKRGVKVDFIYGEHDNERRKLALNKLDGGEVNVLIGSTILDVGVDVPGVGLVVLAGGGKAEVALRQRIGRGLRAKKNGPNVCMVLDFDDGSNKHLKSHAKARRAIVEATPGFKENILTGKEEFPYEEVGFVRRNSNRSHAA